MYYTTTESSWIKYRIIDCEVHQELLNDQTVKYKVTGIKRILQAGWDRTGKDQMQKGLHKQGQVSAVRKFLLIY